MRTLEPQVALQKRRYLYGLMTLRTFKFFVKLQLIDLLVGFPKQDKTSNHTAGDQNKMQARNKNAKNSCDQHQNRAPEGPFYSLC